MAYRSNQSNTWYCPMCDTNSIEKYDCKCKGLGLKYASEQTKVDQLKNDNDKKWGNYPVETNVDSMSNNAQLALNMIEQELAEKVASDSVLGKAIWNAAIEAAAKLFDKEFYNGIGPNDIRDLKK